MSPPKKIVLTGATGFLGSHLAQALLQAGNQLIILKRRSSNLARIESFLNRVVIIDLDGMASDQGFDIMFRDQGPISAVIHASTCYGRSGEASLQVFEANTHFPLGLLQAASKAGVSTFYNIDTILPKKMNDYTLSKAQFAEWGQVFAEAQKLRFVNIRMEHIYGPGDSDSKFTTFVIKSCLKNIPELKLTLGEQKREFLYIDDAVDGILKIIKHAEGLPVYNLSCELACGEDVPTIRNFVELVIKTTNSSTRPLFGAVPYRTDEVMDREIDGKLLKSLGWRRRVDLATGIGRVIAQIQEAEKRR